MALGAGRLIVRDFASGTDDAADDGEAAVAVGAVAARQVGSDRGRVAVEVGAGDGALSFGVAALAARWDGVRIGGRETTRMAGALGVSGLSAVLVVVPLELTVESDAGDEVSGPGFAAAGVVAWTAAPGVAGFIEPGDSLALLADCGARLDGVELTLPARVVAEGLALDAAAVEPPVAGPAPPPPGPPGPADGLPVPSVAPGPPSLPPLLFDAPRTRDAAALSGFAAY